MRWRSWRTWKRNNNKTSFATLLGRSCMFGEGEEGLCKEESLVGVCCWWQISEELWTQDRLAQEGRTLASLCSTTGPLSQSFCRFQWCLIPIFPLGWLAELGGHAAHSSSIHRSAATGEIRFGEVPLKYSASSVPLVALMEPKQTVRYETSFSSGRATV